VLTSCVRPLAWTGARVVAHHLTDSGRVLVGHPAPRSKCECGIYAVHHIRSAWLERLGGQGTMMGGVRLSGMVRRHGDEGVRAEVAEIVALARPSGPLLAFTGFPRVRYLNHACSVVPTEPVDPEMLAAHYGVPLVALEHLTVVAREHGDPLWP